MKATWLIVASFCSQLTYAQVTADKTSIELLLAKEQYSKTIDALQQQPDYASNADWQVLHIQALMGLQKNEDADELMVKALQQFPKHAELYHLAAMNKFALAEQVSIFSAPGYAKEGLAQLKQAVQLAPEQARFQLTLLGFYLQAPGIVGGDQKLARQMAADLQQAAAVQKADPVDAVIAQSMVLQSEEKTAAALQLLDVQLQQAPENVRLLVQKANLLRSDKQDAAALPLYQQAVKLAEKPGAQHQYLYQIGRIVALTGQGTVVGKAALQQVIAFYQDGEGQSLPWARLKLAQIHLAEQDIGAAQQLLQPLLALDTPSDRFAAEVSALQKQLKKIKQKTS